MYRASEARENGVTTGIDWLSSDIYSCTLALFEFLLLSREAYSLQLYYSPRLLRGMEHWIACWSEGNAHALMALATRDPILSEIASLLPHPVSSILLSCCQLP